MFVVADSRGRYRCSFAPRTRGMFFGDTSTLRLRPCRPPLTCRLSLCLHPASSLLPVPLLQAFSSHLKWFSASAYPVVRHIVLCPSVTLLCRAAKPSASSRRDHPSLWASVGRPPPCLSWICRIPLRCSTAPRPHSFARPLRDRLTRLFRLGASAPTHCFVRTRASGRLNLRTVRPSCGPIGPVEFRAPPISFVWLCLDAPSSSSFGRHGSQFLTVPFATSIVGSFI